jgi:hypothetical protein
MGGKLALGTLGAIGGAVVGAIAWAAFTAATNYQLGYIAVGVGFLCGFGMRALSGRRQRIEGFIAAVVALLGCALGNVGATVAVMSNHDHYPLGAALITVAAKPLIAFDILREGFDGMDLLFYGFAVYTAYRTALAPRKTAVVPQPRAGPMPAADDPPNAS